MTAPHYESSDLEPNEFSASDTLMSQELREDPLDAGYATPEGYRGADEFGVTAAEEEQGETLDQRLAREEPDVGPGGVQDVRAGRLVAPDEGSGVDTEATEIATDVGWDGAASAEEAAVHVVSDDALTDDPTGDDADPFGDDAPIG